MRVSSIYGVLFQHSLQDSKCAADLHKLGWEVTPKRLPDSSKKRLQLLCIEIKSHLIFRQGRDKLAPIAASFFAKFRLRKK